MNTDKETIRKNIARILTDAVPLSTQSPIEIAARAGLTTRCVAHTQIHGIIDAADLIALSHALDLNPMAVIAQAAPTSDDDTWHDPRTIMPDADIAVRVITSEATFNSTDQFTAHWDGNTWVDTIHQTYETDEIIVWRHLTQAEADTADNDPNVWQNPIQNPPPEDLYIYFRVEADPVQTKRIGLYDPEGYIIEDNSQAHLYTQVAAWRKIADHELTVLYWRTTKYTPPQGQRVLAELTAGSLIDLQHNGTDWIDNDGEIWSETDIARWKPQDLKKAATAQ